jgi:uncharacterized membrane protein YjjP (DUF1212 family)
MMDTESEPLRPSLSLSAVPVLLLVASAAVGVAARSVWWGIATAFVLGFVAYIALRYAQAVALAVNVEARVCLAQLETKLDALAERLSASRSP